VVSVAHGGRDAPSRALYELEDKTRQNQVTSNRKGFADMEG
jgi:hypothetical protein